MTAYKAIVTQDYLNIRTSGPHRKDPPLDELLHKGDEIMITRAVYGEEIDGDDVWYVMDTGHFVWGGYLATDAVLQVEQFIPKQKKLIFTADDYGVVDTINEGILEAVSKGLLNSVTCLTNYGPQGIKSMKNIRKLEALKEYRNVELGIHLTITSGSPILGRDQVGELCREVKDKDPDYPEGDFVAYEKVRKTFRKAKKKGKGDDFLEQLRAEMRAQMRVFTNPPDGGAPIKIDHLTSHHNSLLFETEFFEIMCELAVEFGEVINGKKVPIPIRSLENKPGWKDSGFLLFKGKVLLPNKRINELKRILMREKFKAIQTPDLLHSNHYGPLPIAEKKGKSFWNLVEKKAGRSEEMLDDLRAGNFDSMEFLLHLRKGKVFRNQKMYAQEDTIPTAYAGINPIAFDARTAEFKNFMERFKDNLHLDPAIRMSSWKELNQAK